MPNTNGQLNSFAIKRFKGESDQAYIDIDDVNPETCAQLMNLSPNRKVGALSLIGGTEPLTIGTVGKMPTVPNGYVLIDSHVFGIDRDSKEITLLVYRNPSSGETKFYINPWYNPESPYSNYNPLYGEGLWIDEWVELTEMYQTIIASATIGDLLITTETFSDKLDDYFNGFFVVNESAGDDNNSKYNFVLDYIASEHKFKLQSNLNSWVEGDTITIVRFPVAYLYKVSVTTLKREITETLDEKKFDAIPTDYHYSDGQLRIACGPDNRPLMITSIFKRKYFNSGVWDNNMSGGIVGIILNSSRTDIQYPRPTITISGGGGSGATAKCTRFGHTGNTGVISGPAGFSIGDTFVCLDKPSLRESGASPNIMSRWECTSIDGMGRVTGVAVSMPGSFSAIGNGLDTTVTLMKVGSGGSSRDPYAYTDSDDPLNDNIVITPTYKILSCAITESGSGYTSVPSCVISGTPACGTATVQLYTADPNPKTEMSFDGLWFSLEQIPQTYINAGVSSFGELQVEGSTAFCWINTAGEIVTSAPSDGIKVTRKANRPYSKLLKLIKAMSPPEVYSNTNNYDVISSKMMYLHKQTGDLIICPWGWNRLQSITITNGGTNYQNPYFDLIIERPDASGHPAKAIASGWTLAPKNIYLAAVTDKGSGYDPADLPTISAANGGGTGAVLTPVVYGKINRTIDNICSGLQLNSQLAQDFEFEIVGTANTPMNVTKGYSTTSKLFIGQAFLGQDASNNYISFNPFVGAGCLLHPITDSMPDSISNLKRNLFIAGCIYDSRNEVIIGLGSIRPDFVGTITHTPDPAEPGNAGMHIRFNRWFDRRLTGISYYSKSTNTALSDLNYVGNALRKENEYPYFSFNSNYTADDGSTKSVDINEIPLLATYDIHKFALSRFGKLPPKMKDVSYPNKGGNSYTYHHDGYWLVDFRDEYNGIASSGSLLTFINGGSRFVSDDTTMNYTRICQVGQTNGRFFISGCKNIVEKEIFESSDKIVYSLLCAGVSAYHMFVRGNIINVGSGSRDVDKALIHYDGFVMVIKDYNVFVIDTSTDDDLQYRVSKTYIGRGCLNPDSVCETPHGVILASKDAIYLVSPSGSKQILREDNGRLEFYRTNIATNGSINAVYYNDYDELFVSQINANTTHVFVYSFKSDKWHTIYYPHKLIRLLPSSDRKIYMVQPNSISRLNENLTTYYDSLGALSNVEFKLLTHNLAFAGGSKDVLPSWFEVSFDSMNTVISNMYLTIKRSNGVTSDPRVLSIPINNQIKYNQSYTEYLNQHEASDRISIELSNNNGEGSIILFNKLNINSIELWATVQSRQFIQTR